MLACISEDNCIRKWLYGLNFLAELWIFRAVSFHPVPRAMARVVFLSTKQIDERL